MTTVVITGVMGSIKEVDTDDAGEWTISRPWQGHRRLKIVHYYNSLDMHGQKHPLPSNWEIAP